MLVVLVADDVVDVALVQSFFQLPHFRVVSGSHAFAQFRTFSQIEIQTVQNRFFGVQTVLTQCLVELKVGVGMDMVKLLLRLRGRTW